MITRLSGMDSGKHRAKTVRTLGEGTLMDMHIRGGGQTMQAMARYAIMAAVLATTLLVGVKSSHAQTVQQYENACLAGNRHACRELYRYANGLCLQGNGRACNYARQVAQYIGQGYQQRQPQYRGDPLTPRQRDTVNEARGYIKSKCDDPNLARQLQAYGFCKGR
jgi:hypothetical protein